VAAQDYRKRELQVGGYLIGKRELSGTTTTKKHIKF
jgi:hypothetical protein